MTCACKKKNCGCLTTEDRLQQSWDAHLWGLPVAVVDQLPHLKDKR